jgi:hypothetical protein
MISTRFGVEVEQEPDRGNLHQEPLMLKLPGGHQVMKGE